LSSEVGPKGGRVFLGAAPAKTGVAAFDSIQQPIDLVHVTAVLPVRLLERVLMDLEMSSQTFVVHSSLLFDAKSKKFVKNQSVKVDRKNGSIIEVFERTAAHQIHPEDIDLRGDSRVVVPGFVDSHTHIFLHSYE